MASPTGVNNNLNPNLTYNQNQSHHQPPPLFDIHQLFKPSPGSTFPVPTTIPSLSPASYPPPTGASTLPFHHLPNLNMPQPPSPGPISYAAAISTAPSPAPSPPPPSSSPTPNITSGARLMALLNNTQKSPSASNLDLPPPPMFIPFDSSPSSSSAAAAAAPGNAMVAPTPPMRMPSRKLPKGRHLIGDRAVYDIDVRLQGEVQPQLEVTPITKYGSDPTLVVGRQIAVNRSYICYGLKPGAIRVLDINTALRALLRGHTQRVTDMAFFAEDVHLLASVSVDGRVFIWKIHEGPDEDDKPQIIGKIVVAIQIVGVGKAVHPRLCWHPHKQENLIVAIGNYILKVDILRVGKGKTFSAEEPLQCPIDRLVEGVLLVGKHDSEITELSMCQWMATRLASASMDGMVKIWDDRKALPLAVLKPHDGVPVNSVTFLTAPHRSDHIVLITAGPLNRELKMWTSMNEEGWLLPCDAESWHCTQTLEIMSSAESNVEEAFFNQVVALPRAGLFLLANAKKNAIYAVHIEYGPDPAATRMDYIAEFTVTMPILSLTGTSDSLPDGDHVVQVYCVQTQAIQQYALNLSQCLPPPLENVELEKIKSVASRPFDTVDSSAMLESSHKSKPSDIAPSASHLVKITSAEVTSLPIVSTSRADCETIATPSQILGEKVHPSSTSLSLSPRLSRNLSGYNNLQNSNGTSLPLKDHVGDQDVVKDNVSDASSLTDNLRKGDKDVTQGDVSVASNRAVAFRHPTHLVTPSMILSTAASSSEHSQISQGMTALEAKVEDVINNDAESNEVEVKVIGETGTIKSNEGDIYRESHIVLDDKKKKAFYSQASDLGFQMVRDCIDTYSVEGIVNANDGGVIETREQNEVQDVTKDVTDVTLKGGDSDTNVITPVQATKGKRQKGKNSQASGPSSSSPSPFNSADSSNEPDGVSGTPPAEAALPHLSAMKDMLNQLIGTQKELQKQMNVMVSGPVTKEGKRLEGSLSRCMEKVVKANSDALWARFQEENGKQEKLERDRTQQLTNLITNSINKDLPTMLEKTFKKEIASIGPGLARSITQITEKAISSAITESFQKGVGEKAVNQLEKSVSSKLEATLARQIQAQFQTSGKQALQDALRSSLESSLIPTFEGSCKNMFDNVDAAFQKGFVKHTSATQKQFESTHSPLAAALRDAINSASTITRTLSGELTEGQRKLLAFAAAGASSQGPNSLTTQLSNGPLASVHEMAEAPVDPIKELSRLIAERKFEEAFTGALHRSDVSIVSWLCSQVDLPGIMSLVPLPLSQGVVLALLQQLACDISNDMSRKLAWMTDVAVAVNPTDPLIALHVRPIFEQVYQTLEYQRNQSTTSASDVNSIRLLMHVINSVLMSCK
ncbi:enhancer of mRNA-decapping protein 4-like [Humulus lupulus]|uniref:enhancer of mRNA-decapping protein 4-like n=1 Tax=Humulus lupulus TaxID=3486 RepID=UPI002B4056A2|nr:enhancer of mRNA-decapping protein 4-like [Humulus lupulus]